MIRGFHITRAEAGPVPASNTRIYKGDMGWRAETDLDLPDVGGVTLQLYTFKSGKGVITVARGIKHEDGTAVFNIRDDFYSVVECAFGKATEFSVGRQHQKAVDRIAALIQEATDHYASLA